MPALFTASQSSQRIPITEFAFENSCEARNIKHCPLPTSQNDKSCGPSTRTKVSPRSFVWGDGFIGTQPAHLPPKFSVSSDFGHFILNMLENAKLLYVSRKKILKSDVPRQFFDCGGRVPRPPPPRFRHP